MVLNLCVLSLNMGHFLTCAGWYSTEYSSWISPYPQNSLFAPHSPLFCPVNSIHCSLPRPLAGSSQPGDSTGLGLDTLSLQREQKTFKLEQSLSLPCLFSSLNDCCPSLPDVQSFENCYFICFVLGFLVVVSGGKVNLVSVILSWLEAQKLHLKL